MIRRAAFLALPLITLASHATAEIPHVVADIAPIQSLVQQVMGDLAAPPALMPQGASPHGYALRPSEARALQAADVVFWTGPLVEPGLGEMIDKVAADAKSVPLAEVEGATVLPLREGATFEPHMHEDEHDEDDHEDAGHGEADGHAWLDPMNARLWLGVIAEDLSEIDPENAGTYHANAAAAQADLDRVVAQIESELTPISEMRFIVFHDAYHYFENRFGLAASGSISLSDASAPSPARIREIQDTIKAQHVTCVFSEPQFNPGMVKTVLDGTKARTGVIDPLGATLTPGAGFYAALMEDITSAFVDCGAE